MAKSETRRLRWAATSAGNGTGLGVAEALGPTRAVVLHDRRIPGSKANIDHIAVAATGVYVIDAKRYRGRIEKRDVGGWFRTDERLYVRGRDHSRLLDSMGKQLDVVRTALRDRAETTPVSGVFCFVGAEWPGRRPKPIRFDTVTCMWPTGLPELIEMPGRLGEAQVQAIAARLAVALPQA